MKNKLLFFVALLCMLLNACKSIKPKAPSETYLPPLHEKEASIIHIPLEVAIPQLENFINNQLKGLLYETTNLTQTGVERISAKISKNSNIIIHGRSNYFDIDVPLKIWLKAGIQTDMFGVKVEQAKETEFALTLHFSTRLGINEEWQPVVKTSSNGYDWINKPVLKLGFLDIPLEPVVNKILQGQQANLTKLLDQQIQKQISIKPYIQKAWEEMQKPILLSEAYKSWLKITPLEIAMTPLSGNDNVLKMCIGIKSYTETILGDQPKIEINKNLPLLKLVAKIDTQDFAINIIGNLSHQYATEIAKKEFVGKTYTFQEGKYNITIDDLNLYGSGDLLVIKTLLKGSLNGTVYLKGKPFYDAQTKMLSLKDVDFDIETRNVLVKAANWLMHGKFVKKIQESFQIPLEAQMNEGKNLIQKHLTAYKVTPYITLDGNLNEFSPNNVFITPDAIVATLLAKGSLKVLVNF